MTTSPIKISRRQIQREALRVPHHAQARHWVLRAGLQPLERGCPDGTVWFDARELLAFFERERYITYAAQLREWIRKQEGA